ncbi:alpha/beta fold hydrolase [Roseomonas gilardii]|uniref:Alpha/beta fold hydrolase n=1 Tax=Roseomonas gilardii TaxID=257708 RepID=A0ABU3MA64_9PROT|nr:alpha/beta fold hydrolase [Roseomonas gilardii]MDT8329685.1 alpha/beta fold hydrolase [Roseomonas gilardii]PZR10957.1 MAG: alpha/beta hydrolase [Azospirillum brasilense]
MKARFSALDGHSGIAYRPGVSTRIPLLLLPGLLNDARLWHHQTEALAGIAESRVPDISLDDSMAAIAARVLASAPERFALAGLSMGGYVCFEIMRQAPERVLRLALFDTSARPEAPEQERRRRGLMSLTRGSAPDRFRGVTPRLMPQILHPDHLDEGGGGRLGQLITDMAMAVGREGFLRQQAAILGRPDSRPGLGAIRVPALVAVGEADAMTPPALSEEIAAGIPGAALHRVPRSGHLPPLENPPVVNALMRDWLLG